MATILPKKIIEHESSLKLSQRDATMLVKALDAPTTSNLQLQQAAKRYAGKTQS